MEMIEWIYLKNVEILERINDIFSDLQWVLVIVTFVCPAWVVCFAIAFNNRGLLVMASKCESGLANRVNIVHQLYTSAVILAMKRLRFKSCVVYPHQPH